jgi:hypothetical protein
MKFHWAKKGIIFKPNDRFPWSKTHSTLPTPIQLSAHRLRVFYTSRDVEQMSRISFVDISVENPSSVLFISSEAILDVGQLGTFDDRGLTSSHVMRVGDCHYLYYNGYNIGRPARYRVGIGLAISKDNCDSFARISEGPIMDRSIHNPCGCATPFVIEENGLFRMWYSSFIKWEWVNGAAEPFYQVAYAESNDGVKWVPQKGDCINLEGDEGGIVRPSVVRINSLYYMWYSVRKKTGYRNHTDCSYRIGVARSTDGINWTRMDDAVGIGLSPDGWDSQMIAYPYIMCVNNKLYMFYNGNGFGQSGFGYAELVSTEVK